MSHNCKAVIVHCIDFRFQKALNEFLQKNDLIGNIDRISIPGGVKDMKKVLEYVELSVKLHGTKEVYLVNHQDCGAYGLGEIEFTKEKEIHKKDLEKMKKILSEKIPGLKINILFLLKNEFAPLNFSL
ncbi:hypothetical protein A2335_00850 [Candidatus Peregrinibacteria bacterium RIFOXYB2_FULL_32_7]|nr:MAG: hypothetical protein A2335_00850 [Candidatus Peregrinibacteria bacterium RIFOXYB2_FULL_32_7]